ncbi:hypothetical protein ACES2L_09615 [Bdellovibrio bacteriovorus]
MERLNKETLSFPAWNITKIFAALGMVLTLAACGKDGGGSVAVAPNGITNCSNCSTIVTPVTLATFESASPSRNVTLKSMSLIAQSSNIQPNASGNNYNNYQGPVAAQGSMIVTSAQADTDINGAALSSCVLQAGTYIVETKQVGQLGLYGTNLSIPLLVARQGSQIVEMKIEAPGSEGMGLYQSGTRVWAKVSITRINNITCSSNFYGLFD